MYVCLTPHHRFSVSAFCCHPSYLWHQSMGDDWLSRDLEGVASIACCIATSNFEIAWAVFANRCDGEIFIEKEELVYRPKLLYFLFFSMHFPEYFKDAQVYLYILIYFYFSLSIFVSLLLSSLYPMRLPLFLKFSYKKNDMTYAYVFRYLSIFYRSVIGILNIP